MTATTEKGPSWPESSPPTSAPLALRGAHSGEFQLLTLLHAQLGPEYVASHSVHWSFGQGQGTRFGEIDFILGNRAGAVLRVEQITGVLSETLDGPVMFSGQRQKSVGAQIHHSLDRVCDMVSVHPYREADDQARHLDQVLGNLISLGFALEEIVILSLRGVDQSPL